MRGQSKLAYVDAATTLLPAQHKITQQLIQHDTHPEGGHGTPFILLEISFRKITIGGIEKPRKTAKLVNRFFTRAKIDKLAQQRFVQPKRFGESMYATVLRTTTILAHVLAERLIRVHLNFARLDIT